MTASIDGLRWVMATVGQPMVQQSFNASPGQDEVVVEIAGCGVCHTDLGYFYDGVRTNQPLPLALGHEISGRVVAAGDGAIGSLGRAVIVPAVLPCGDCEHCRRGRPNICRRQKMPGNDIQGGFATHIVVPARGLCEVDEHRLKKAGLALADVAVVADAVTTPYQAVVRAELKSGSLAIVVGAGGVGGYACQIAHAFGAKVVAIDIDSAKLATIVQHTGALALNAREYDQKGLRSKILDYCKAEGLPATEWTIFECSGTAAGQLTAYGLLTYGATLCVVGFTMAKVEVRLSNLMAFDARAIGTWGCPPDLYPQALALVLDGKINLGDFVEQRSLSDINSVFAEAHDHKLSRRAILVPQH
jgi:6-hydroxycyclohex-1-ene-1-carbonyl-CoA dehydrogenase